MRNERLREALEEIRAHKECVVQDGETYEGKAEELDYYLEQCVSIATKALEEDSANVKPNENVNPKCKCKP